MLDSAIKLLKKIENKGFSAYIVGGFVRDYILGIKSLDIDIATNATPKDIKMIFKNSVLSKESYGSVTIIIKNVRFEVTTFRKEASYVKHRKPSDIEYINDLLQDLKRRDFTINTICMDSEGKIIDLLGGKHDLKNKMIKTVGNSNLKFKEDSFRMLRAIRFATTLNFSLSEDVKKAIILNKHLLKELSYIRKRQELDKIFVSPNARYGITLLKQLGLDEVLELHALDNACLSSDINGIWASLDVDEKYYVNKNEKILIRNIQEVIKSGKITKKTLYKYGLYICTVAADILGLDRSEVTKMYEDLPIFSRKGIEVTSEEIIETLKQEEGPIITIVYNDLEMQILEEKLENNKENIIEYIITNYC